MEQQHTPLLLIARKAEVDSPRASRGTAAASRLLSESGVAARPLCWLCADYTDDYTRHPSPRVRGGQAPVADAS